MIMTTRDIIEADATEEGWEDQTWVRESDAQWYRDRCVELEAELEKWRDVGRLLPDASSKPLTDSKQV